ncbi:neuronal acetylcholine receptor subunit beta-2-like [Ornithodoros turicata]|uniref:neuronal acetylcholine receptor subunit beta-2-like n=1 Tax=Ornithodoros turicata TaxID=34597 RepID=UPI0031393F1D
MQVSVWCDTTMRHVSRSFMLLLLTCRLQHGWAGEKTPDTLSSRAGKTRSRVLDGKNYDASVRPTKANSSVTTIHVAFPHAGSWSTDEDLQYGYLDVTQAINLVWYDDGLAWSEQGSRTVIPIHNLQEIWTPGLTPVNALQYTSADQIVATSDGVVILFSHFRARLPCDMDMTEYPNDEHNCTITFAALSYPRQDIEFKAQLLPNDTTRNISKWQPVSTWTSTGQFLDSSSVQLVIRIRRVGAASFRYTIIIPTAAVAVTTLLVLWLPVRCGRRVTLACFNFATTWWLLLKVSWLFESSATVPKIVIYLSLATATNAAILVWSVLNLNIAATSTLGPCVHEIAERFLQHPFTVNVFCLVSRSAGCNAMARQDDREDEAEAEQPTMAESALKEDSRLMTVKALDRFAFYAFFFVLIGTFTWSCI